MNGLRECVDVGLVFALGAEQAGLVDHLRGMQIFDTAAGPVRRGMLPAADGEVRTVASIVSGPGRVAAAAACEALLVGHRPRWVISAGFAGGLVDDLPRLTIVAADSFAGASDESDEFVRRSLAQLGEGRRYIERVGPFVTVARIAAKSADKQSLHAETRAIVCEMESSAVIEVCRARDVPATAIRVVFDTVDEDLPTEVARIFDQRSTPGKIGAVLGSLWRRPSTAKDLWNLHERSVDAAAALGNALIGIIAGLPKSNFPRQVEQS